MGSIIKAALSALFGTIASSILTFLQGRQRDAAFETVGADKATMAGQNVTVMNATVAAEIRGQTDLERLAKYDRFKPPALRNKP